MLKTKLDLLTITYYADDESRTMQVEPHQIYLDGKINHGEVMRLALGKEIPGVAVSVLKVLDAKNNILK